MQRWSSRRRGFDTQRTLLNRRRNALRPFGVETTLFFTVINLCALQFSRIIHVNGLPFREQFESNLAGFPMAVPGAAHAAERKLDLRAGRAVIDVNQSGEDIPHCGKRAVDVLRED